MSDQPQKFTGEQVDKARDAAQDYLQDNPDQARSLIDKVEDVIDERTGGQFSGMVDKAGDWAEEQLNLPEEPAAEPTTPAEAPDEPKAETPPAEPTDAPAQAEPTDAPAPADAGDPSAPPPLKG